MARCASAIRSARAEAYAETSLSGSTPATVVSAPVGVRPAAVPASPDTRLA